MTVFLSDQLFQITFLKKPLTFTSMITEINIQQYLELSARIPLIDVRSPSEFEKGHIPGAFNIPLFSNEERTKVGTVFTQESKEKAITLAYEFVTPKLDSFIQRSGEIAKDKSAVIHCWRGGMRSHAFAEHLESNGFSELFFIAGGYKAFRNYVMNAYNEEVRLNILGGYTGSGKTQILKQLKEDGLQVIDLENIANHKGSVFGGIGNSPQPGVEQFENNLYWQWKEMDLSKPVWLEDESLNIGHVQIPKMLYQKMNEAVVFFLDIPKEERANFLVSDYSVCEKSQLASAIQIIKKRIGDLNTRKSLEWIECGNYYEVAMTVLSYYDKSYLQVLEGRDQKMVFPIKLCNTNHKENAKIIMEFAEANDQRQLTNDL